MRSRSLLLSMLPAAVAAGCLSTPRRFVWTELAHCDLVCSRDVGIERRGTVVLSVSTSPAVEPLVECGGLKVFGYSRRGGDPLHEYTKVASGGFHVAFLTSGVACVQGAFVAYGQVDIRDWAVAPPVDGVGLAWPYWEGLLVVRRVRDRPTLVALVGENSAYAYPPVHRMPGSADGLPRAERRCSAPST